MPKLFTIGYEGAHVGQLIQTLENVGIEVRDYPLDVRSLDTYI